jgi:hypothetical protein
MRVLAPCSQSSVRVERFRRGSRPTPFQSEFGDNDMTKDGNKPERGAPRERGVRPKRGAIPTPTEVIERVPRYEPKDEEDDDDAGKNPPSRPNSQNQTDGARNLSQDT